MAFRRTRQNIRRPYRRRRAPVRRSYRRRHTRATPRLRRAAACSCEKQLSPGDKFVLVQADPFEPKFAGSKVPDSSTIPSISTPLTWSQALTTGAATQPNWLAAWAFYPSVTASTIAAVGTSATAVTWTGAVATDCPQRTAFSTQFEAYRSTAHAIRISCPFAPTSTTGFVHVALGVETAYTAASGTAASQYLQLPTSVAAMSGYSFYKRVTLASLTQSPLTIINKWTDETAFRYQNPAVNEQAESGATGLTLQIPYSWGTLVVMVEGSSAVTTASTPTTPLQAEIILHSECIPEKASTLIGSTAASANSGLMNAVSQAVANTDFSHTENDQAGTIGRYMSEVADAAGINGENIQHVANTAARRVVNAGLNYGMQWIAGRAFGIGGVNNDPNRLLLQ